MATVNNRVFSSSVVLLSSDSRAAAEPVTAAAEFNRAIIKFIIYTCALFGTDMTWENWLDVKQFITDATLSRPRQKEIKGSTEQKRRQKEKESLIKFKTFLAMSKKCRRNKGRRRTQSSIQMKSITDRENKQAVDGWPDSTDTIWQRRRGELRRKNSWN